MSATNNFEWRAEVCMLKSVYALAVKALLCKGVLLPGGSTGTCVINGEFGSLPACPLVAIVLLYQGNWRSLFLLLYPERCAHSFIHHAYVD